MKPRIERNRYRKRFTSKTVAEGIDMFTGGLFYGELICRFGMFTVPRPDDHRDTMQAIIPMADVMRAVKLAAGTLPTDSLASPENLAIKNELRQALKDVLEILDNPVKTKR